ncbi:MAG: hypothetical protein F6K40_00560 [Okeania sp. SIO3I5]|uniref:hypothetical protein n=1 Tax=Okeania sp. SIO3I5 TaxID=2607805 RepID=UPI0013B6FBB3|nr:hypothetical protein [Okeania sp. SIO3I5]NEQ34879.1 hypothetical protein [Okeania sp. SIO3I5]
MKFSNHSLNATLSSTSKPATFSIECSDGIKLGKLKARGNKRSPQNPPKTNGYGCGFPRSDQSPLTFSYPKSQLAWEKTTRQKKIRFCLDKLKKQVFNSKKLAYGKCEGWKAIASSGRINLYLS